MSIEIQMPTLGLTMTEGTVDSWIKKEGDSIEKGEVVCEISSEKLSHGVEAVAAGILLKILVTEGDTVPCGAAIGLIGEAGEAINESPVTVTAPETDVVTSASVSIPEKYQTTEALEESSVNRPKGRIFASPLARRIAKEKGYDIAKINGTGGNGRITRRDVEHYIPMANPMTQSMTNGSTNIGAGLEGMRKIIATRMMNSLLGSAQVTIHQKANLSSLVAFKAEIKEKADMALNKGQLSITTLLSKAVVLALKDRPKMNAWYGNGQYQLLSEIHLGIAVSLDEGLVVPVVKNADKMSLTELGSQLQVVIEGAREGTISSDLMTGSTFTITNLGKGGAEYFTPVLNTPEIGILGVGSLSNELALNDEGEVYKAEKLPLSLTFDHQVIDGAPAADFLARVVYYLEHPYALVL